MRLAASTFALALALSGTAAAAPAAAQGRTGGSTAPPYYGINGIGQASSVERRRYVLQPVVVVRDDGWQGELRQIDRRIRRARENGEISRREARALRREVAAIRSLGSAWASDGLSDSERNALDSRTFALREMAQAPARPARARH